MKSNRQSFVKIGIFPKNVKKEILEKKARKKQKTKLHKEIHNTINLYNLEHA